MCLRKEACGGPVIDGPSEQSGETLLIFNWKLRQCWNENIDSFMGPVWICGIQEGDGVGVERGLWGERFHRWIIAWAWVEECERKLWIKREIKEYSEWYEMAEKMRHVIISSNCSLGMWNEECFAYVLQPSEQSVCFWTAREYYLSDSSPSVKLWGLQIYHHSNALLPNYNL